MRRNSFFFLFTFVFVLMSGLFTSAFSAPSPAYQANPTQQQATLEARVNDLFTQTAVANIDQTATMDALTATAHAIETEIIPTRIALTQTAAVESTVQAEFNQRVTATAAFNATVDARVSELVTATAVAASQRGEIQIDEPMTTQLENAGGDRWTFQGLAGELVLVEMSSTAFTPYLELYDPNNQLVSIGVNSYNSSRLGFAITQTGTYTLLARCSSSGSVGSTYTLTLKMSSVTSIDANDFDTYPGGYQVTVNKYEINEVTNIVRIYFEATASQTDLRSPDGTYLLTQTGNAVYPINQDWTSDGLIYYSGWMEFDASFFRYDTALRLVYCGCGFYEIPLTDLTSLFTFPSATPTPFDDSSLFAYPTPTPPPFGFAYPTPTSPFPATISPSTTMLGNWNFTWDQEVVDCPTTQITYFNFTSNIVISPDGGMLTRNAYGDATASYYLISPGVYSLAATYTDLSATVTSETIQFLSPTFATGQRTDVFAQYTDCIVYVTYRMEYINGG